jgi:predicted RNA methylase
MILLILSVLNIGAHLTGFYYGKDLFSLFSTLILSELLLIALYLIITIYKWIESDFRKIQTEQISLSSQVSRLNNVTLERIESQKEFILEAISLLKEQTNLSTEENKKELKLIQSVLEKIGELSEDSVQKVNKNNEDLKSLDTALNEKANKLLTEFTKVNTDNNSLLTKLDDTNQAIGKNFEELKSIKTTVNEEANKLLTEFTQLFTDRDLELNSVIEKIHDLIETHKTKITEEKIDNTNEFRNLEKIILNEINQVLNKFDLFVSKNDSSLNNAEKAIKKDVKEIEATVLKQISLSNDNQKNQFVSEFDKQLNITYDRIDALMSIHALLDFNKPFPIMHEWTISSDFAHAILTTILDKGEGSVIDIGSGVSTLLMGYGVMQNGSGKVISLEHSKEYFEKTKALIKAHQLESYCEVHFCPLIEYIIEEEKWLWYDISDVKFPEDIALMSVDGPPGDTQLMARYPAIPILEKYITDQTIIYLDDAYRSEEAEIAKKWELKFDLSSQLIKSHKGIFHLKKNGMDK